MITSFNTKANETEKATLQDIGKGSAMYLRNTHAWPPTLAAHSPGYSLLDDTQLIQNDRQFPRYYVLHPHMGGFNNGVGLAEADLADAQFLLISNRTADASPRRRLSMRLCVSNGFAMECVKVDLFNVMGSITHEV
ncbi:hypothetical protein [Nitrospira sp. M1]